MLAKLLTRKLIINIANSILVTRYNLISVENQTHSVIILEITENDTKIIMSVLLCV